MLIYTLPWRRFAQEYMKKIFMADELEEASVIRNFRITASDVKNYNTKHHILIGD